MKRKSIALIICMGFFSVVSAQTDYRSVMESIQQNHPDIIAAKKALDAEKVGLRTGLNPSDPSVQMEYKLRKDESVDLSVLQDFDFPTVYRQQNRISKLGIQRAELAYHAVLREIMTDARQQYVEIVYLNKRINLLRRKYEDAQKHNEIYTRRLEQGDVNQLDKNSINAAFLTARTALRIAENELRNALVRFSHMNGGQAVAVTDTVYPEFMFFGSQAESRFLNEALENDYYVMMAGVDTVISGHEIKLNRALWMPGFQVGYKAGIRESRVENSIIAGIRIPLWKNRNKVTHARLQQGASVARQAAVRETTLAELKSLYNDYRVYSDELKGYREFIAATNSIQLLNKALDAGEISLTQYLLDVNTWYNTFESAMEIEKRLVSTRVEMSKYIEF